MHDTKNILLGATQCLHLRMTLTLYQVADCETEGRDLTSLQVIMPAGGKISATAYEKAGGGGGFL